MEKPDDALMPKQKNSLDLIINIKTNNHDISNKCINVLRPDDYAYEICVTQMLSLTRLQNFEFKYLSPC